MKRAVETIQKKSSAPRQDRGVAWRCRDFAIVVDPQSGIYEPEQLKERGDRGEPVQRLALHHAQGWKASSSATRIKIANAGTHRRTDGGADVRQGRGREPAGAVDQRRRGQGRPRHHRVALDPERSRRRRDGRPDARQDVPRRSAPPRRSKTDPASSRTTSWPRPAARSASRTSSWRASSTRRRRRTRRERFDDNYNWTLGWGPVPPGATYENTVDNRALN